jgi:signal peptidase I
MARASKSTFRKKSYQQSRAIIATILKYAVMTVLLVLLLHFVKFVFGATYAMPNDGMLPTYAKGDMLLASSFGLSDFYDNLPISRSVERGDVVVLQLDNQERSSWLARFVNPGLRFVSGNFIWIKSNKEVMGFSSLLIKRVIALPGDTVRMQGNEAFVRTPGSSFFVSEFEASTAVYELSIPLRSEQWIDYTPFSGDVYEHTLGDDEYFVLGDNRQLMNDSRIFGTIGRYDIHAVVLFKYVG